MDFRGEMMSNEPDRSSKDYIRQIAPQAPSPLKSIRQKCLDCVGGSPNEIRECPSTNCALWPYRMGRNPYLELSEEEKERRREVGRKNVENLRR